MRKKMMRALGSGRGLQRIAGVALGVTACAPHPASLGGSLQTKARSDVCELVPAPSVAAPSLRIAVTDAVAASDAPVPRTDAERVIFPLLYLPPSSGVTCHGRSGPVRVGSADATDRDVATTPPPAGAPGPVAVWPVSTGRYEVATAVDTALDLLARRSTPGPALHVSRIRMDRGRDALDGGTDVLITADATTIAYAAARADLVSVPLPWSYVYVLVQPDAAVHMDRDTARTLENDLATDAVRVDARAVDDAQWREVLATCDSAATARPVRSAATSGERPASQVSSPAAPLANRIVYADDDDVARALSERLVALANTRDPRMAALAPSLAAGESMRAAGYDTTRFRDALKIGRDAAYVAALSVTGICRDVATLASGAGLAAPDLPGLRAAIAPLIETRAHAIVRRGRVGVAVDDAGDVFLEFGPSAGP